MLNELLAAQFKAIGDPNHLQIIWTLDQEEMCVYDLVLFIGMSKSAISQQLRQLR